MEKFKLKIPIFSNSNIVIGEECEINGFTIIQETDKSNKGIVEITASDDQEKYRKLEEIKNLLAIISLEKSEETEIDFFIYPGEPEFFNVKTCGIYQSGLKEDIYLAIGKEETFLGKNFIEKCFHKWKSIAKQEKSIMRALRWYNYGKFTQEDGDSVICFIVSSESILSKLENEDQYKDQNYLKELNEVIGKIDSFKINDDLKQKIRNCLEKLRQLSFKEKVSILIDTMDKENKIFLYKKAQELGLINNTTHKDMKENIVKLLGIIYKDRSKIIHAGEHSVEKISKKRQWLEIFIRKILINKINEKL